MSTETVKGYWPHRHACSPRIEMRYSISGPKSNRHGYLSHQNAADGIAADGIAADLDRDALR
jgi:hypothetical protein